MALFVADLDTSEQRGQPLKKVRGGYSQGFFILYGKAN